MAFRVPRSVGIFSLIYMIKRKIEGRNAEHGTETETWGRELRRMDRHRLSGPIRPFPSPTPPPTPEELLFCGFLYVAESFQKVFWGTSVKFDKASNTVPSNAFVNQNIISFS